MAANWTPASDEEIAREYEEATLRAREADRAEPRADFIGYDRDRGLFIVELKEGFGVCFSPGQVPGLAGASTDQLADVRISPSGDGLHWDRVDVHASLTGLVIEGLRLRNWAPRLLGQIRSEAKAKAARANGRKGGRPRKAPAAAGNWTRAEPELLSIKGVGPRSLARLRALYGRTHDPQEISVDRVRQMTHLQPATAAAVVTTIRKALRSSASASPTRANPRRAADVVESVGA
jgi:hypothetical protein